MLQHATAEEHLRFSEFFRIEAMTEINASELYTNHSWCTSFAAEDSCDEEVALAVYSRPNCVSRLSPITNTV
jgi:hypothetical protein